MDGFCFAEIIRDCHGFRHLSVVTSGFLRLDPSLVSRYRHALKNPFSVSLGHRSHRKGAALLRPPKARENKQSKKKPWLAFISLSCFVALNQESEKNFREPDKR